jgi:dienelactone hydrolase
MFYKLLPAALLIWAMGFPQGAFGQQDRSIALRFDSITPTSRYELVHRSYNKAVTQVTGTLSLPDADTVGPGPWPAMVIAHGSAGLQAKDQLRWVPLFNRMGIATLVVDSFGPRGVKRTDDNQAQLDPSANDADALAALRLLAADPRIDAQRIGVMGFSRGGGVALETAVDVFRRGVIDNAVRFAAHVAFYPGCGLRYWRTPSPLTGAPIMMALAGRDDYTPAAPCLAFAEAMRAAGQDVEVHVYADAYHDFDNTVDYRKWHERAETGRACEDRQIDPVTWQYSFLKSGESFTDYAAFSKRLGNCVVRGVTSASNPAAARQAEADVRAFLRRVFKLRDGAESR